MKSFLFILFFMVTIPGICLAQNTNYVQVYNGDVEALKDAIVYANNQTTPTRIRLYGVFEFGYEDELPPISSEIKFEGEAKFTGTYVGGENGVITDGGPDRLIKIESNGKLWIERLDMSKFRLSRATSYEEEPLIENYGELRIERSQFTEINGEKIGKYWRGNTLLLNLGDLRISKTSFVDVGFYDVTGGLLDNRGSAHLQTVVISGAHMATPFSNSGGLFLGHISLRGNGRGDEDHNAVVWGEGSTTIVNSIFSDVEGDWCAGVTSLGHNLIDDGGCAFASEGDISGVHTGMLALAVNAIPYSVYHGVAYFPLSAASPAIDSADPEHCNVWDRDILGVSRNEDGDGDGFNACDRGAFEYVPSGLSDGGANGLFYDPNQDGHYVYILDNDANTLVVWNTFDVNGNQAWVLAAGKLADGKAMIADAYINESGALTATGPVNVARGKKWGTVELELDSCNQGKFYFNSELSEFTSGQFEMKRLASVKQLGCQD